MLDVSGADQGPGMLRLGLENFPKTGQGLVHPALTLQYGAQAVSSRHVERIAFQRPTITLGGCLELAASEQDFAQVDQRRHVARLDLDRAAKQRFGLGHRLPANEGAQVVMRTGVARVELDRVAISAGSLVELAHALQAFGQVEMRFGRRVADGLGPSEAIGRLVQPSGVAQGVPELRAHVEIVGR